MSLNRSIASRRARAALVGLVSIFISSCASDYPGAGGPARGPGGAPGAGEPRAVQLVPVGEESIGKVVVGTGTLAADEQTGLSFKVPGRVNAIGVACGGSFQDEAEDIGPDSKAEYVSAWQRDDPQFAGWRVDKADSPAVDIQQAGGAFQRLTFAVVMGVIGGFFPARRASKLPVIQALR